MSVTIGGDTLYYKTDKMKYITTYITEYNPAVDSYLNRIFDIIIPSYSSRHLMYSNVCGANAEFVCKTLKMDGIRPGKIIITEWVQKNAENLAIIASIYEPMSGSIGMHYHALVYLEIKIDDKIYYVAIETTLCVPYKLQFYVGNNIDELKHILKTRYQCNDFKISHDCEKSWYDIAYNPDPAATCAYSNERDYGYPASCHILGGKTKMIRKRKTKMRRTKKLKVIRKSRSKRVK
jgi:hypothetical protein